MSIFMFFVEIMRLGVDLDETKINTVEGMLRFYDNKILGVHITKEDITNYHMEQIPCLKLAWLTAEHALHLFDTFLLEWPLEYITAIQWCREALVKLKSEWIDIVTITARHTGLQNKTYDCIDRLFPGLIDDVIFANHYTKNSKWKWVICRENNIELMVDDNMSYAEELATKWIGVHLLDQPRNRLYDPKTYHVYGIRHHKNWDSIPADIVG